MEESNQGRIHEIIKRNRSKNESKYLKPIQFS